MNPQAPVSRVSVRPLSDEQPSRVPQEGLTSERPSNRAPVEIFIPRVAAWLTTNSRDHWAEALAPFVRDEIADALEQITRRWQLKDWADAPRDSDPVRERLANAQYVTGWLRTRAEDVRRG